MYVTLRLARRRHDPVSGYKPSLLLLLPTLSLVVCLLYTYLNTSHPTTDAFDPLLMAEQAPSKPNPEGTAE